MPKTCPQCQRETTDDANHCPNCGAALNADATTAPATGGPATGGPAAGGPAQATPAQAAPATGVPPQTAPSGPAAASGGLPPFAFDVAKLNLADRIAAVASFVLLVSLFLSWFGITIIGVHLTASGISAHGWLWIVFVLCLAILAYLVCIAGWGNLPFAPQVPHLTAMIAVTLVNLVLVLIAFFDQPGVSGVGWEYGAFVALIAAIVAAAPYAIPQLRARTMG
jgi:hypothetical protein